MMKRTFRGLTLIAVLLSLAILAVACKTITSGFAESDPSADGSDQPSGQTRTVGSISGETISLLGSGFSARQVLDRAGLSGEAITAGHYRLSVDGSENVICDLQVVLIRDTAVIRTAIQSDQYGHKLIFSPVPDSTAINDYQIITGGTTLSLGDSCTEQILLQKMGEPLQIVRQNLPGPDGSDSSGTVSQTWRYPGLAVDLLQPAKTEDPESWRISAMTFSAPDMASPRGLQPGMSYREAISLLGTGDFILCPDQLPSPTRLTVCKATRDSESAMIIELTVSDQVISAITMSYLET